MKTQVPKIKIENGKLQTEGDFKFELSPTIITENFIPIKKVKIKAYTIKIDNVTPFAFILLKFHCQTICY